MHVVCMSSKRCWLLMLADYLGDGYGGGGSTLAYVNPVAGHVMYAR